MTNTDKLTNQEVRTLIISRKKSGDIERCAMVYEYEANYISIVISGSRENRHILEDMVTVIENREEMEKAMIHRRALKVIAEAKATIKKQESRIN